MFPQTNNDLMDKKKLILLLLVTVLSFSCGTYFNQPIDFQEARLGEATSASKELSDLGAPQEPIVVGVYNFRDQTGQFRQTDAGSSFSTAVTQGSTAILIKALEDSNWFLPIEREQLNNLLNERNIIRSTRQEYSAGNGSTPERLAPLLFAGTLLEGGIVSYDTNIVTGGLGARYFGIGGSTQYREDRVTVYLRAVSTSTGEILKTVYVSKTILSQGIDASFFRFVRFQRLLEAETGFTRNEPVQLAVTEAIEKSVKSLILEGIKDGLWTPRNQDLDKVSEVIQEYELEKEEAFDTKLYDRLYKERRGKNVINASAGTALIDGDFASPRTDIFGRVGYKRYLNPFINLGLSFNAFNLQNDELFAGEFFSVDFNAEYTILPYDKLSPYIYGGAGTNSTNVFTQFEPKVQYGVGLEYLITDQIGLTLFGEQNFVFSDELDGVISGSRDDFYYRFGFGLNIYLNKPISNRSKAKDKKREERKNKKLLRDSNVKELKRQERIIKPKLPKEDENESDN